MRYAKEQIDQWITESEQSGLSIIKYCTGKPFDKSTFYNWRKKLIGSSEVVKKTENLYPFKSHRPIFHT
ncbi:MAG: transposase [Saprospiraceae bacterium]|nr:transposase [Saprospiraceae bacterium]